MRFPYLVVLAAIAWGVTKFTLLVFVELFRLVFVGLLLLTCAQMIAVALIYRGLTATVEFMRRW